MDAELERLRQRVAELEGGAPGTRHLAADRLRDAVWRMRQSDDILAVAQTFRQIVRDLDIEFQGFGINVAEKGEDGTRFFDYTGGSRKSLPPGPSRIMDALWTRGETVYRPDLQACDEFGELDFLERWQIRSVVDVPFSHGTVALSSQRAHAFSPETIDALEELAGVLSEGFRRMEDFQLLEQRNRQLEEQMAASARRERQQQARFRVREQIWGMRTSDDIALVLGAVSDGLRDLDVPFHYCGVNLVGAEAPESTVVYTMDSEGQWRRRGFSRSALIAEFWKRGKVAYRRDLLREDPYNERSRLGRLRSIVDVPFSSGTLAVSSRQPGAFTDADLEVLADMARVLSEGFQRQSDLQTLAERNRALEQEVADRIRVEEELRRALDEKVVLLKEVHHRVKNNLQVVSSLLNLQASYIEDRRTLDSLRDSRARIDSMALVHERLYESEALSAVDLGDYLSTLARQIFAAADRVPESVDLDVQVDSVPVGADTAIHCGLWVNELISNSLKYAFPGGRRGRLSVRLERRGNLTSLSVSDDGVGLPAHVDYRASSSLGMQLVADLATQLEGQITLDRQGGTRFEMLFSPTPEDEE